MVVCLTVTIIVAAVVSVVVVFLNTYDFIYDYL